MGLLRDAIGSALGANQVNNGLSGPRLPFGNKNSNRNAAWVSPSAYRQSPSLDQGYASYTEYDDERNSSPDEKQGRIRGSLGPARPRELSCQSFTQDNCAVGYQTSVVGPPPDQMQQWYNDDRAQYSDLPPRYETAAYDTGNEYQGQSYDMSRAGDMGLRRDANFRPLALPQIAYGHEQPFLRGYTMELSQYGISEHEFIGLLDAINVAIIPNPEHQIFQKGANMAGFFLPGAAGIGLMVGQIGVGLGSAVSHASAVNQILSSANLQLFLPKGLEICIGKTEDVNAEVGLASQGSRRPNFYGISPEERQAYFGDLIAPLSRVLPPFQQNGRNDPIAQLGRGLASRTNRQKIKKANKDMAKGKTTNIDSLEGGLKWLMVRRASADALEYWRKSAANNAAQEQAYARPAPQNRYSR
ncbi:uncharacterized protein N7498_000603 [Penicillium cinerascens]|uniref:Uncharacterized protein n=1 Tax=Penicillium cinerascens TaxID=70096 RepID=A0A9W9NEM9_9EURO|nr:uncharacterized protein N7498_000603 [Penicillium cinerascens]KAJ5218504.1 hypothetical protein N7498_000603 [Penicillium cinerascens]